MFDKPAVGYAKFIHLKLQLSLSFCSTNLPLVVTNFGDIPFPGLGGIWLKIYYWLKYLNLNLALLVQ